MICWILGSRPVLSLKSGGHVPCPFGVLVQQALKLMRPIPNAHHVPNLTRMS